MITAHDSQLGTLSSFNQAISMDRLIVKGSLMQCFSYGSGASSAVCLLLKELVISKGANISAHLPLCTLVVPLWLRI